tara:strand:- start:127 stop:480 length:354 start_codon:yes stop_codon:yes gene_type:complete
MKISKLRLKQIIKEELQNIFEQENANVNLANAAIGFIADYTSQRPSLRDRRDASLKFMEPLGELGDMRKTGNEEVVKHKLALMVLNKVKDLQGRDPELFSMYSNKGKNVQLREGVAK